MVETYDFGSEFVTMQQAVEMLKGLKYKIWMFGIYIMENETKFFGDTNAVILRGPIQRHLCPSCVTLYM